MLADVNGSSGIQTQAYATRCLATLRKSLTKLETAGYTPGSLVIHTGRLGRRRAGAVEHERHRTPEPAVRSGDADGCSACRSPPRNAQAAGVGHVIASGAVALDTDTRGVDVQWSENATAD